MNKIILISLILILLVYPSSSQTNGALIPDFKVNDDMTNYIQEAPSIGVDGQGNFVISWNDRRNTPMNLTLQVYCQRFAFDGTRLGVNFRIGPDTAGNSHVAVINDGRFIIAWAGKITGKEDLYAQRFFSNGTLNGNMIKINDTNVVGAYANVNDIGADSIGNFTVVWTDYRNGVLKPDVYGQRIDSSGNRIGNNFKINDNSNNSEQVGPRIAVNKDGSFVVCWVDWRSTITGDIYMQRYDKNGNLIGNNQRVDDDTDNSEQRICDVASDGRGYFVVSFDDYRDVYNTPHVYYQIFDSLGNKIGINRKADENIGQTLSGGSKVAMQNNGKFVIMWNDGRFINKYVPFCQRFTKDGSKIEINFQIPININFSNSGLIDGRLFNDRIYSAWNDNRNGDYDIWCNVRSFINPDSELVGIGPKNVTLTQFTLNQNYPNPFNPKSNIKFQIAKLSDVKLTVFDVLGREVAVLVNQQLTPGTFEVDWDGSNYPSGVYFYKLTVRQVGSSTEDYTQTRKMVLLK